MSRVEFFMFYKSIYYYTNILNYFIIKGLTVVAIIGVSFYLMINCALALSDLKYNEFKHSSNFSAADNELSKVWKEITSNISNDEKQKLLKDQREWIKSGWDNEALNISSKRGLSLIDAYTEACLNRIAYLKNFNEKNINDKENNSNIKVNKNISEIKKVGIYDFYLGEDLNSVLKKCIENKYYINIKSNSNLPDVFSSYINNNTNLTINGDLSIDHNNVDGKYLNIIRSDKTNVSTSIGAKSLDVNLHIPESTEELINCISSLVKHLPAPSGFFGGSISEYVPDILNKFGIICDKDSIDNIFNKEFSNFIDNVSKNENNKYDVKSVSLQINNQVLNMFFMNSPGININNVLFFMCLNASKVSNNDTVKEKINNVFLKKFGNPEVLSRDISYYIIGDNLIFHDESFSDNIYYFINKNIMNYFIKSSDMLYRKYNDDKNNSLVKGM